ncbi:MAG: DUF86 domain-containing protein [Patescibacteria group bacterium]
MIKLAPLNRDRLRDLIEDIESCRHELQRLTDCEREDFEKNNDLYATTEHYFRRALEGILTAGTHILSRLPTETKDYTEIITELGRRGIISEEFAQRNKGLAGYRNRLVHLYWDVSSQEMFDTIKEHLDDISVFAESYAEVLRHPEKWNLTLE